MQASIRSKAFIIYKKVMGIEDMLEPIKEIVEDGLEKIVPKDKEGEKWDTPDEANAKSFENNLADSKKEEQPQVKEGAGKEDEERLI